MKLFRLWIPCQTGRSLCLIAADNEREAVTLAVEYSDLPPHDKRFQHMRCIEYPLHQRRTIYPQYWEPYVSTD